MTAVRVSGSTASVMGCGCGCGERRSCALRRVAAGSRVRQGVSGRRLPRWPCKARPGAGKSTLWRAGLDRGRGRRSSACCAASRRPARPTCRSPGCRTCWPTSCPLVVAQIPGPQREALEIALLLRPAGDEPPTARAVGLAVLAALRGCLAEGPVAGRDRRRPVAGRGQPGGPDLRPAADPRRPLPCWSPPGPRPPPIR